MTLQTLNPFNLEEFRAGKLALTRDGRTVEFVGFVEKPIKRQLSAWIHDQDSPWNWSKEGKFHGQGIDSGPDLIAMAPEEKTLWFNVYLHEDGKFKAGEQLYESEEVANRLGSECPGRVGVFSVTIKV